VKKGVIAGVAVLALLAAGAATADTTGTVLTLNPVSDGAMTRASWQAGAGRPDAQGQANQALVLEAPGTADTSAAALFRGFEGIRVRDIQSLAYEHRLGTTCNKTDPRWTLFIRGKKRTYLVNLGCALTPARPTDDPKWFQRVYTLSVIQAEIVRQVPGGLASDALNGVVDRLALVVDRSNGAAYLDNVAVRTRPATKVWTFAGDDANGGPGGPAGFTSDEVAMLAAPLADAALWDEADVLASVTPDEQALIDASNASTD
jgi:hypothetical protein